MDFDGLLFLGFLYFMFRVLTGAGRKSQQKPRRQPQRPPRERPPRSPVPQPRNADATQREGSKLEQMLRELERSLEDAGRVGGRQVPERSSTGLPQAEEVEDRTSLEEEPVVVSLETEVPRPPREEVSFDERAAAHAQARIKEARQRDRALTLADHQAFDARIRAVVPDHTTVDQSRRLRKLQEAVVWREILGPPKALEGS